MAASVDDAEQIQLDVPTVRKLVAAVRTKLGVNIQRRGLHAGDPSKFMESEIDLDTDLQRVKLIAVSPEYYADAVDAGVAPLLVQLIDHENVDVACSTADVLLELTDPDAVSENETAACMVAGLVASGVVERLVELLRRLSEDVDDEMEGVQTVLHVVQNVVDAGEVAGSDAAAWKALLEFLLRRLLRAGGKFEQNKANAAEVLASVLQSSPELCEALPAITVDKHGGVSGLAQDAVSGVHAILQALSGYTKLRDSVSDEEAGYVENLTDALCAALMTEEGRTGFEAASGVQLMLLLMIRGARKKKKGDQDGSRKSLQHVLKHCGFKVIVFAVQRSAAACESVVDHDGLGVVCPFLLLRVRRGSAVQQDVLETRVSSVMYSLSRYLTSERLARYHAKYTEDGYAKADRLVEMLVSMVSRRDECARRAARTRRLVNPEFQEDAADRADELSIGLALQHLSAVIAVLLVSDACAREHVEAQLRMNGVGVEDIGESVGAMLDELGEEEEADRVFLTSLRQKLAAASLKRRRVDS
eukprot:TRINITY_DN35880_c0_g1_i1.p1 TRINITY_DN35880_c0_g1~~TRINITY_DN35880_c0_g1_i1.p1  ORF type:complete len:549 (+),score=203.94 TRINITY_DN35880_c0_g1_i1:55-1647(+)